jgi:hypothetical protein
MGMMSEGEIAYEVYAYRTGARFGSRVTISVEGGTVTVTGPRVGAPIYRLWIAAQVIVFWSIVPALAAATILWNWRYLLLALALVFVHWLIGTLGAVGFWELENLNAFSAGTRGETTTFALDAVERVKIGRGWARKGLWLAIPPVVPLINQIAKDCCVSFEAPEVYALHMRTAEDAQALAGLLERRPLGSSETLRV